MKNMFKKFLIVTLIILPVILLLPVKADSGRDSSWDSGGSWSSGSSWDSGYSPGSGHSGNYDEDSSVLVIVTMFIFIMLVMAVAAELSRKKVDTTRSEVDLTYDNEDIYHEDTSNHKDVDESLIQKLLPNENLNSLKTMAFKKFVEIQNAWSEFEYDKLRDLLTDELYNSYVSQLETLKLKNGKNVMSDFNNMGIKITSIKEEAGNIILTVYLKVSFYDYVINKTTDQVTRGRNDVKLTNNYMMTFIKSHSKVKVTNCPSCGVPIKGNTSRVCEYCDSTIITDTNEFVMSKKTNLNKRN